jgi:hypothetical protein
MPPEWGGERLPLALGGLVRWDVGTTSGDCGCHVAMGPSDGGSSSDGFGGVERACLQRGAVGGQGGAVLFVRGSPLPLIGRCWLRWLRFACVPDGINGQEGDGEGRRDGVEEKREMLAALYDRHAINGGPTARKATNGNRSAAAGMILLLSRSSRRSQLAQPPTPRF